MGRWLESQVQKRGSSPLSQWSQCGRRLQAAPYGSLPLHLSWQVLPLTSGLWLCVFLAADRQSGRGPAKLSPAPHPAKGEQRKRPFPYCEVGSVSEPHTMGDSLKIGSGLDVVQTKKKQPPPPGEMSTHFKAAFLSKII